MRPVIGQKRKWQATEVLGPPLQARDRIRADLQDFDAGLLELIVVRTELADLILSSTGEGERQERDDRRFAAKAAEGKLLIGVRGEGEVRRRAARFDFHAVLLLFVNAIGTDGEGYWRSAVTANARVLLVRPRRDTRFSA
jgi:hypothetical protein